jgi:DNA uptake protein ComE-like DNA-binding protein
MVRSRPGALLRAGSRFQATFMTQRFIIGALALGVLPFITGCADRTGPSASAAAGTEGASWLVEDDSTTAAVSPAQTSIDQPSQPTLSEAVAEGGEAEDVGAPEAPESEAADLPPLEKAAPITGLAALPVIGALFQSEAQRREQRLQREIAESNRELEREWERERAEREKQQAEERDRREEERRKRAVERARREKEKELKAVEKARKEREQAQKAESEERSKRAKQAAEKRKAEAEKKQAKAERDHKAEIAAVEKARKEREAAQQAESEERSKRAKEAAKKRKKDKKAKESEKQEAGGEKAKTSGEGSGDLDLNAATFEELRETGLSVTEVTRILTYRNRSGGFKKLSDLDSIPGLEKSSLTAAKKKLRL